MAMPNQHDWSRLRIPEHPPTGSHQRRGCMKANDIRRAMQLTRDQQKLFLAQNGGKSMVENRWLT